MSIKILFVEDDPNDLKTYQSTLKRYKVQYGAEIESVEVTSKEEAIKRLDSSFDGAIVDLKLIGKAGAGNDVTKRIHSRYRIPIAVFTATPSDADPNMNYLGIYKKGERTYDDLFNDFLELYETGITKIMGGRGLIEKAMDKIFWCNINPNLNAWVQQSNSGKKTENALLRFFVSHLLELLDHTEETYFPEEMYISPPFTEQIKTGCVVKEKESDNFHVILTPACDLALNSGNFKTNRILVCLIEKRTIDLIQKAKRDAGLEITVQDDEATQKNKQEKKDRAEYLLTQLPRNNYSSYYHYLPRSKNFDGGVINFRKIKSHKPKEFGSTYEKPTVQISGAFTKDIVARFSSYYARQGQPNFDFDELEKELKT